MVNAGPRTKKKDVNLEKLGEDLLKFAQENSPKKMELDIAQAKIKFGHFRNIILEAYAFGPEELRKYKIVDKKTPAVLKEVDPPCLSGKGTITIKKYYLEEYNKRYSENKIDESSSLDVTFDDGKIILVKK